MTATSATVGPLDFDRPGRVLSTEQRRFFEKNGYLLIPNVVGQSDLDKYRQRFQDICEKKVHVPTMTVMKDVSLLNMEYGQRSINKLQDWTDDDVLFGYCQLPQIVTVVKDLIGDGNIMAMHTMLINKPPDAGTRSSRHPMHQDLHYFPFRPANRIVCSWTAMEPVNRQNGCLVVIPGSHKGPLHEHGYPQWEGGVNKMYHGIVGYDPSADNRVHVQMQAGDTLFFHPLLVHGSGTNMTKGFRKAISCHYANGSACKYIEVKGTTQENIADEIQEIARRRFGDGEIEIDFADVWRFKSKSVSGPRANL
jgi:phytanoyl-CoA hydroxylase